MYASDIEHSNSSLADKLQRLYTLNRDKNIDLGFRPPYLELLEALGNPHRNLPPVIHVAGTNGKGSTIAIMRSILEAAGYSVHVYTSPHLIEFNERIVLAGETITNEFLEELIDETLQANAGGDVTFFEITTALAFTAFSRIKADIVLLEVGLGGRLDCTNIIEKPALSVITPISMDHMDFLGNSLPEIAAEKAGIIKAHAPCIAGPQTAQIWPTLKNAADSKGTTLFRNGSDWFISAQGVHICFESAAQTQTYPRPALTGAHQIENAGTAIAALKTLDKETHFRITDDSISKGLKSAKWPARLQKLPIDDAKTDLWLDGGHNQNAGQAIATQCEIWTKSDPKPFHLILGMMAHKDVNAYLEPMLPHIKSLSIVNIPNEPASLRADALKEMIAPLAANINITAEENWQSALSKIQSKDIDKKRILIAGSLYLAGHVLKELKNKS